MADLLQAMQVGAQISGGSFDRSLRTQQLRLQEAQQRLQERQMAQQAQYYTEQALAMKAKREEQELETDLKKAAGEAYALRLSEFRDIMPAQEAEEAAFEAATKPLALANPKVYIDLQNAKTASARVQVQRERNESLATTAAANMRLQSDKIDMLDRQFKEKLAQNDKLTADKIAADLKVAHLRLQAAVRDRLGDMGYRAFLGEIKAITDSDLSESDKAFKIQKLYQQAEMGRYRPPTGTAPAVAPGTSAVPKIGSKSEFDKLPKGTKFIWSDGKEYVK